MCEEGVDYGVEVMTLHEARDVVQSQPTPMICDATLRKVISGERKLMKRSHLT